MAWISAPAGQRCSRWAAFRLPGVICQAARSGSCGNCESGAAAVQASPAAGILAGSPLASETGPRMSNAVARSLGLAPPKDLPGARARTLGEPFASA